ncbi:amino acid ABC transporter substrate-binding protein [Candidatus Poribacteria bacterium]|nr:amino acid ABC transporter substrate-binding protein [Candidatus Poribacteria bacterium]MYA98726.1 amino acid ABC transporter substrate-binding protein [Candidatus Poribacteria bacterium]
MKYDIIFRVTLFTVLVFILPNANANNTLEEIREKGVLTVCMDVRNLPYSNADPELPGLNVEIAHLLAEELGVELELHWLNTLRDSLLADMLRGHCDCVIGIPIEERAMSESIQLGKRIDFSKPYYGTGYVLVKRKNNPQSPKTLNDIKSETIGAEGGSIASDVLRQLGYNRRVYGSQVAVLNALQKGQIAYGCVWANAGWLIEKGSRIQQTEQISTVYPELEIVEGYIPESRFRWNVSIAFSKGTPERRTRDFQDAVNKIIEEKWSEKKLKELSQKYHLPYFAPFQEEEQQ